MTVKRDPRANLHKGHAAKTAESRARSVAGLKRGNVKHGAFSQTLTAPIEKRERRRLRTQFPNAAHTAEGGDLIRTMATRLALIGRYVGHLRDEKPRRQPDEPAAKETRLLLAAHERAIQRLADLERQAATEDPGAALQAVLDEYANQATDATVVDKDGEST